MSFYFFPRAVWPTYLSQKLHQQLQIGESPCKALLVLPGLMSFQPIYSFPSVKTALVSTKEFCSIRGEQWAMNTRKKLLYNYELSFPGNKQISNSNTSMKSLATKRQTDQSHDTVPIN